MMITLVIFLVFLTIGIMFWLSEHKRGQKVYSMAVDHENAGEFEEACYLYAIALGAGRNKEMCRRKIRELWQLHGPFDFRNQHDNVVSEYCRDKSCGEGFDRLIVDEIHRLTALPDRSL